MDDACIVNSAYLSEILVFVENRIKVPMVRFASSVRQWSESGSSLMMGSLLKLCLLSVVNREKDARGI